jgi:Site-specific recombinase XerD
MNTLEQAMEMFGKRNGIYTWKYMTAFGIRDFDDCTSGTLAEFVAYIRARVAPSTAKLYAATLQAVLNRYKDQVPCSDFNGLLNLRAERSQKVYLTEDELARLEQVHPRTRKERYVQLAFLISSKTGMRVSDATRVTPENLHGGILIYVSQKTNKEAKVPVSDKVAGWIWELNEIGVGPNLSNYELAIKRMCMKAGVDTPVKIFRGGEEKTEPKWKFVGSHTARVTFCTIMHQKGVPVMDICIMAGHSSPVMTERYIIRDAPVLNDAALSFLNS